MATQLMTALNEQLSVEVPYKEIFVNATLGQLVDYLQTQYPELAPATSQPTQATDLVARVSAIWKEVLSLDQVSLEDDFFDLGGHSLMATQMIADVRDAFDITLTVKDIFTNPTLAELAARIREVIEPKATEAKLVDDRPEHLPLSFAQERLWFIDQLEGSEHYHIPAVMRLDGDVHLPVLELALRGIVDRHEALRTVYYEHEGEGCQKVLPKGTFTLPAWKSVSADEVEAEVARLVSAPFQLNEDLMLRAHVLHCGPKDWRLVVVIHHIAADGWSIPILFKELEASYGAILSGDVPKLPTLKMQYPDYALQQRTHLTGARLEEKLSYWERALGGGEPLNLPTDFPRPARQSFRGDKVSLKLPDSLVVQAKALARQQDATVFMLMLSVYTTLLHRYTRQSDLSVGTPVANRAEPGVQGLVGFFNNTLVLRQVIENNPKFTDLLASVKTNTLEAFEHQDTPFEKIVNRIDPDRDPSRTPLFQAMFVMHQASENASLSLGKVNATFEYSPVVNAKFDLTLGIVESEAGMQLELEYCADLFAPATMERMAQHFVQLLTDIVAAPNTPLGQLAMILPEEITAPALPAAAVAIPTILDQFSMQVEEQGSRTALVDGNTPFTYTELEGKAKQFAQYLTTQGVVAGDRVAVCLSRSADLVVSYLAIMKLGAAYVPVDPAYPSQRIGYLLENSQARVVITNALFAQALPAQTTTSVVDWDAVRTQVASLAGNLSEAEVSAEDTAYVIYTSGSTGQPKGVMVSHGALSNLVSWHLDRYEVTSDSRATLMAGVGFDASTWEIWPYLSGGATLCVVPEETKFDLDQLGAYFNELGITHSFVATALVPDLLAEQGKKLNTLQFMLTGGDSLAPIDVAELPFEVVNNYGPTENAVVATAYTVQPEDAGQRPSIGKAIDFARIHLLDAYGNPMPEGMVGELCISGRSLAQGYWNAPELTAEKFVTLPLYGEQVRVYKTGDLARRRPDGNLVFMGRVDDQVQIRGYRIELEEVEKALADCKGVAQGVVVVHDDAQTGKSLVGYVVPEEEFDRAALETQLRARLPQYMVPAFLVGLESLPLTANGKIDKKQLPAVDLAELGTATYEAPTTEIEQQIAQLWQSLLNVPQIGLKDDFFQLGGNSLLAVKATSATKKALGVDLALHLLFESPQLADYARHITILLSNTRDDNKEYETITL